MRPISGPGNVANTFADYDPISNPLGTVYTAQWGNDVQNELLGIESKMGVSPSAGSNQYVASTIIGLAKRYGKMLGEFYPLPNYVAPSEFNPATPTLFHPGLCLTNFDGVTTIAEANWPDLHPFLRIQQLSIGSTLNFSGSASASTITLDNNADNIAILTAIAESVAHFGYNYTVTWGGTDFAITDIATLTRVITVTGTPTAGAGDATFFPHRIAGSTTTARVFSMRGLGLIGLGDADRYFVGGLARRGYMQGHKHYSDTAPEFPSTRNTEYGSDTGEPATNIDIQAGSSTTGYKGSTPVSDGTYGTPRTAKTTNGPSWSVHIYQHGGRYTT